MSAPCTETYVYCDIPTVPVSEVVTVQPSRTDDLAATGPVFDPLLGLTLALAAIILGSWGIVWSQARIRREEAAAQKVEAAS